MKKPTTIQLINITKALKNIRHSTGSLFRGHNLDEAITSQHYPRNLNCKMECQTKDKNSSSILIKKDYSFNSGFSFTLMFEKKEKSSFAYSSRRIQDVFTTLLFISQYKLVLVYISICCCCKKQMKTNNNKQGCVRACRVFVVCLA